VKPSTIQGAGLGVFAPIALFKGDIIGVYKGMVIKSGHRLFNKVPTDAYKSDRVLSVFMPPDFKEHFYIDARASKHWVQFINHYFNSSLAKQKGKMKGGMPNVEFVPSPEGIPFVRVLRRIKPGGEMFVDYGEEYGLPRMESAE
jgi:hypothetical protein